MTAYSRQKNKYDHEPFPANKLIFIHLFRVNNFISQTAAVIFNRVDV